HARRKDLPGVHRSPTGPVAVRLEETLRGGGAVDPAPVRDRRVDVEGVGAGAGVAADADVVAVARGEAGGGAVRLGDGPDAADVGAEIDVLRVGPQQQRSGGHAAEDGDDAPAVLLRAVHDAGGAAAGGGGEVE